MKPKINYVPSSISFMDGFSGPRGNVGYCMVFDLQTARDTLTEILKKGRLVEEAVCGLDGDWNISSDILYNGKDFFDPIFWDNSIWATPIMMVFFKDGPSETYEVWKKEDLEYGADK